MVTYINILPPGYNTWLDYYNSLNEQCLRGLRLGDILTYITSNKVKYEFHPNIIKSKCFDEIMQNVTFNKTDIHKLNQIIQCGLHNSSMLIGDENSKIQNLIDFLIKISKNE